MSVILDPEPATQAAARKRGARYWLPVAGLLLFTAALPIENTLRLPLLGSLGRTSGLLLLLLAVPAFIERRRIAIRPPAATLVLLGAFALWAIASLLWSQDQEKTSVYASTVVQLLLLAAIVWQLCRTSRERLLMLQAYVVGAWAALGSALWNLINGREAVFGRYSATGTDPNDFALMVVLAVPMAWEVASRGTHRAAALNFLFLPAAVVAVVISGSRGGALALAVAMLVVPLGYRSLSAKRRHVLHAIGVGGLATLPFVWQQVSSAVSQNIERLMHTASDAVSGSLNARDEIWTIAIDIFGGSPVLGVGGGAFPTALEAASGMAEAAHNTLLSVGTELGVVGLCIFAAAIIATAAPLLASNSSKALPSLLLLLTWLVGTFALTWEVRKPTWIVLLLVAAYRPVLLSRLSGERSARADPLEAGTYERGTAPPSV